MKRALRHAVSDLSYRVIRLTNGTHPGLRALTYHRVTDAHPEDRLCVPVAMFAQQMRSLHGQGYQTVALEQAATWIAGEATLPPRAIVLTFDDGFEDNFVHAYPELARYGFTACFFVPSAFIESGPQAHRPKDRPMTWEQLRELLRHGQAIGAHSVTHRKLTLLDETPMRWEVQHCKDVLERSLNHPVESFCYPAGNYNASVRDAVRAAGYRVACTVRPGANRPGTDVWAFKRTEISGDDSLWDFQKKLAGAYDLQHAALQALQWLQPVRECQNAVVP